MSNEFGVWGATAPAAASTDSLRDALECDVAIVGAGYTGLSTALHLAERGLPAVILEANQPGFGASGRNTGWVEPNWWLKRPADIVKLYGTERGSQLSRWVAAGPKLLERWEAQYALDLQRDQRGLLLASDEPGKAAALESEARDWQALGVPNEFLDGPSIARAVAVAPDRYCGAMLLRDGMTLNPLALCRGLARACRERGARVFERSPVVAIAREAACWRLTTPQGQVRCRRLVLATDAYTRDLWPELAAAFSTWRVALIASEPYPELRSLLPGGHAFADMGLANIFTLRGTPQDHLVTSTFAPMRRTLAPAEVAIPFMRKFVRVFPGRPLPRWRYVHFGDIGLSQDMLPHVCRIGEDAWTAFGYSGTGINFALLLGAQLAGLAAGGREQDLMFPMSSLTPMKLRRAASFGLRYVHAPLARHLVSRLA
ncbi:MAG TPA: FAD-dependent oxidoreductase [Vicinamibacterales bacterium]|nr:FAD-dependent oxidoreductase [Vicinamibacterales bacterium]